MKYFVIWHDWDIFFRNEYSINIIHFSNPGTEFLLEKYNEERWKTYDL